MLTSAAALQIVPFVIGDEVRPLNGDYMKRCVETHSEAIISLQLSALADGAKIRADGFVGVETISVVRGEWRVEIMHARTQVQVAVYVNF